MPLSNNKTSQEDSGILRALMPGANIYYNRKIVINHSTSNDTRVLNIGGTRFETYADTLRRYPHTRLADDRFLKRHYRDESKEYFFDHDPEVFKAILQYLRTGELHLPASMCGASVKTELEFWGVEEGDIEDCCWLNYNSWAQTMDSLKKLEQDRKVSMGTYNYDPIESGKWPKIRNYCWQFLNNPNWSIGAKIYGAVSMLMVLLSILSFVCQTHEYFQVPVNASTDSTNSSSQPTPKLHLPWSKDNVHPGLYIIDLLCFFFFLLEFIARFIFHPSKLRFFLRPINVIDLLALVPDVVAYSYLLDGSSSYDAIKGVVIFVSLLRIVRILRIFRLMRYFPGLWTLGYTLKSSLNELLLMLMFLIIGMLVYSSLIYYAEERDNFPSIPRAFWWAIITMTTVGYGDMYPVTNLGYFVGSMTAVSGLLLIGFIVPVLVNNFILYYNHTECALVREKRHDKRVQREKRKQKMFERMSAAKNGNVSVDGSSSPVITTTETKLNGSPVNGVPI
ncbi:potassium voltage-gated channel protein Shaw [Patella vulgata]|uniref:potassium voltage-gated channel protein Shaw n=1 Tax=Patella vulgata TaxID=6465 RepID=UPI0021800DEB|nr:potassium voltage-gated channel protein Shaw [Patella vulgata]